MTPGLLFRLLLIDSRVRRRQRGLTWFHALTHRRGRDECVPRDVRAIREAGKVKYFLIEDHLKKASAFFQKYGQHCPYFF